MENLQLIIEAIDAVKSQAEAASAEGDSSRYRQLMIDLLALENCLVTEVKKSLKAA